ncbi:DUF6892 domain-containing protein [Granulicoccus phenolivorans]|uniref:DUF6892 domain-containing protein n=1 Tax=Granulicoccus phenolivorans TaxID=266854 RepID=UPI0004047298|nr:hypothetical protein [Granulicoccus phenolivorans]
MKDFDDFVVKLMVIEQLLDEEGGIEAPHSNAWDWLEEARGIDHDGAEDLIYGEYFAKRIPEIETWARDLEISAEQMAGITELDWDGGLDIFMLMAPSWDGEDDLFDVATWTDVTPERFPALTSLTYVGELEDSVREALEAADVELEQF